MSHFDNRFYKIENRAVLRSMKAFDSLKFTRQNGCRLNKNLAANVASDIVSLFVMNSHASNSGRRKRKDTITTFVDLIWIHDALVMGMYRWCNDQRIGKRSRRSELVFRSSSLHSFPRKYLRERNESISSILSRYGLNRRADWDFSLAGKQSREKT